MVDNAKEGNEFVVVFGEPACGILRDDVIPIWNKSCGSCGRQSELLYLHGGDSDVCVIANLHDGKGKLAKDGFGA